MYESGTWLGHWDQDGLGRQRMHDLRITFQGSQLHGQGSDCIGDFTMKGEVMDDAEVRIVKTYDQAHSVVYRGRHDGEGTISGVWALSGDNGTWAIRMQSGFRKSNAPITEILP